MNSFGSKFRVSLFGESHGKAIGVVVDGVPAGMELSESDFMPDLARRRSGAPGTTTRREEDVPELLSGVYNGRTTGAPIALIVRNNDTRSGDYDTLKNRPRPSHADFAAMAKFGGFNDPRGGGHFSGRVTLAIVMAGVIAKKVLKDITISARIAEIGGIADPSGFDTIIESAVNDGDSLGGIVECIADGLSAGMGEPFFDSVESVVSHLLFSIPAIRGVEFGSGFSATRMRGSEHNDPIILPNGNTLTNNAGGVNGGLTNGNPLVVRVAVKPASSIAKPQQTIDMGDGAVKTLEIVGRHDACIALRVPVVVEAAVAIALAQF